MAYRHTPVLLKEVISGLRPQPGQNFVDGTVGGGGHAEAILKATSPAGRLVAFDRDPSALRAARAKLRKFGKRVAYVLGSYSGIASSTEVNKLPHLDGVLLDLGFSSAQLDDSSRGFSFLKDGPLNMRYDSAQAETAEHLLNSASEQELAKIFHDYGDEPQARRLSRRIVEERRRHPLRTTADLLNIISQVKGGFRHRSLHPATLVWQALRIAVNNELDELAKGLIGAAQVLSSGGRLVVISFHSGEDRIVKNFMRRESRDCLCPPEVPVCRCGHTATFKSPTHSVKATVGESNQNPRARSAILRLAQKI